MKREHDAALIACLEFIREVDALKKIERRTKPMSIDRRENSAEHSWHLAVMAMVLAGQADKDIDLVKVIKMLLVHDMPEVHADDVFVYDRTAAHEEAEREGARKLFGLLPDALAAEFMALWEEFEAGESDEAQFARALDRFQPCFCNYHNGGGTWIEFGIAPPAVLERNGPIKQGSAALWRVIEDMVETGKDKGYFPDEKDVKYG